MLRTVLAILVLTLPAFARQPLHMWTDKDGVLHVDDTAPSQQVRRAPRQPAQVPQAVQAARAQPPKRMLK